MDMTYRILTQQEHADIYHKVMDEDLLWAFNPQTDGLSLDQWMDHYREPHTLMLGGWIDGVLAGFLDGRAFGQKTQCMEIGVCAFRPYFHHAAALSRGAYLWCFDHLDCVSLVGRVAAPNRHVLRMAPSVGFHEQCRIPGLLWYTRKQRFVDGVIVMATKETVLAACRAAEEE